MIKSATVTLSKDKKTVTTHSSYWGSYQFSVNDRLKGIVRYARSARRIHLGAIQRRPELNFEDNTLNDRDVAILPNGDVMAGCQYVPWKEVKKLADKLGL